MYDALRAAWRFRCPDRADERAHAEIRLSRFHAVERLDGPAHPPVYRVGFGCGTCGGDHVALVPQDELDLGLFSPPADPFWDPLTGRLGGDLARELAEAAADRVRRGVWPWTFWCSAERRLVPAWPSALRFLAGRERLVGVALTCPSCEETSLNLVTSRHLDEPWYHDRVVHALERPVGEMREIERFREWLWSDGFGGHELAA